MHFGQAIVPFAFKKGSCQIFASSGETMGSVWPPWPGVPGGAAVCACAGIGRMGTCVWGRFDPSKEKREALEESSTTSEYYIVLFMREGHNPHRHIRE